MSSISRPQAERKPAGATVESPTKSFSRPSPQPRISAKRDGERAPPERLGGAVARSSSAPDAAPGEDVSGSALIRSLTPERLVQPKSAVGRVPGENSNDYPAVVVVLADGRRVIECNAGIQWIIQKRAGENWRSTYFCRTKEGMLLYAGSAPELLALPDYFPAHAEKEGAS